MRLFASLRDAAGRSDARLELAEGATAEAAWQALVAGHPALAPRRGSLGVAVNRDYAGFETVLQDNGEVAFIPLFGATVTF